MERSAMSQLFGKKRGRPPKPKPPPLGMYLTEEDRFQPDTEPITEEEKKWVAKYYKRSRQAAVQKAIEEFEQKNQPDPPDFGDQDYFAGKGYEDDNNINTEYENVNTGYGLSQSNEDRDLAIMRLVMAAT
jgi:hypothetical protein